MYLDRASPFPVGATATKRASIAVFAEVGDAATVGAWANDHQHTRRAAHCLLVEIYSKRILAKLAFGCRRGLHFHVGLRTATFDPFNELSHAVRRIAVDLHGCGRILRVPLVEASFGLAVLRLR